MFLDAGHGGIDPGGVGTTESGQTIEEANETLPVEQDTAILLERQGYTVVESRSEAETVIRPQPGDVLDHLLTVQGVHDDVAARDVCANRAKADILVGIYFDAGSSPLDAGSVTGYDSARPFAAQNLRLATLLEDSVQWAMNGQGWDIPDLGVEDDTQLGGPALTAAAANYDHLMLIGPGDPGYFTTPSDMPGAVAEPLFVTDPDEASLLATAWGQEVIAGGLALAVNLYFTSSIASAGATGATGATGSTTSTSVTSPTSTAHTTTQNKTTGHKSTRHKTGTGSG